MYCNPYVYFYIVSILLYVYLYILKCLFIYIYIHTYKCICIYIYICLLYIYIYIYIYTYTSAYTYIYIYIHMSMYILFFQPALWLWIIVGKVFFCWHYSTLWFVTMLGCSNMMLMSLTWLRLAGLLTLCGFCRAAANAVLNSFHRILVENGDKMSRNPALKVMFLI